MLQEIRKEMRPIITDLAWGWKPKESLIVAFAVVEIEFLDSKTVSGVSSEIERRVNNCIRKLLIESCVGAADEVRVKVALKAERHVELLITLMLVDSGKSRTDILDLRGFRIGSYEDWLADHIREGIDSREIAIKLMSELKLLPWLHVTLARSLRGRYNLAWENS